MNKYLNTTENFFAEIKELIENKLDTEGFFFLLKEKELCLLFIANGVIDDFDYELGYHLYKKKFSTLKNIYTKLSKSEVYENVGNRFAKKIKKELPQDYFYSIVPHKTKIFVRGQDVFEIIERNINIRKINHSLQLAKHQLIEVMRFLTSGKGIVFPYTLTLTVKVFYQFKELQKQGISLTTIVRFDMKYQIDELF